MATNKYQMIDVWKCERHGEWRVPSVPHRPQCPRCGETGWWQRFVNPKIEREEARYHQTDIEG